MRRRVEVADALLPGSLDRRLRLGIADRRSEVSERRATESDLRQRGASIARTGRSSLAQSVESGGVRAQNRISFGPAHTREGILHVTAPRDGSGADLAQRPIRTVHQPR